MTSRYPDIEIYIKRVPLEEIVEWLRTCFSEVTDHSTGHSTGHSTDQSKGTLTQLKLDNMICNITENVAKGGYTSVWFKENQTPWETDLDCARIAYQHFGTEVRCSTGGWEGSEDDESGESDKGGWIRITEAGEQQVNWLAS